MWCIYPEVFWCYGSVLFPVNFVALKHWRCTVSLYDVFWVPVHSISSFPQSLSFVENRKYTVHPNTAIRYSAAPWHCVWDFGDKPEATVRIWGLFQENLPFALTVFCFQDTRPYSVCQTGLFQERGGNNRVTTALPTDPPRAWPGQDLSPLTAACTTFLVSLFPARPSQTGSNRHTEVCYEEDRDETFLGGSAACRCLAHLPPHSPHSFRPAPSRALHAPMLSNTRASATGCFNEVVNLPDEKTSTVNL